MDPFLPRAERLASLEATAFDLLVIGGGITGAAVARDAAARGLSVVLLERDDWASGTSSRSSKLVHGGLRYLKTGNVRLVFESLSERAILMRAAPHLVRPSDFLFPSYRGRGFSPLQLELGLTAYDLLALGRSPRWHRRLSRDEVLRQERLLESPELVGGALYSDARTDDARLTLENVLDAVALGAVAISRVSVDALEKDAAGILRGVQAQDQESGRTLAVRARIVVNATGPWGDRLRLLDEADALPRLRLSRGAHVSVPAARLAVCETVAFPMDDGRLLFAIPFGAVTLLGTTDTDHTGSLEGVVAAPEEVSYILRAVRRTFPAAGLTESDVIAAFAGLRPLLRKPGVSVGETSREEAIEASASGLLTVTGGKLTTHRRMGEKAVDVAVRRLRRVGRGAGPSITRDRPFPGAPDRPLQAFEEELIRAAAPLGVSRESSRHLVRRYGSRAGGLLALIASERSLAEPLVGDLPDLAAEIVFAARSEDARSLSDALARRTHLFWQAAGQGREAVERSADLLARELEWPVERKRAAIDEYAREIARSQEFKKPLSKRETALAD